MSRLRYLIIVVLAIFCSDRIYGQGYTPLLDKYNEWQFTTCNFGCLTDSYYTDGDTMMNGFDYKILDGFHYISRTFLIREDTISKQVFLALLNPPSPPKEYLLYDFSLSVGDSMDVFNPISPFPLDAGKFIVDSIIPRTLVDGNDYQHFYLHAADTLLSNSPNAVWIEGVGSLSLINAPGGYPDINDVGKLSCFFKSGNLHYSDLDSITGCDFTFTPTPAGINYSDSKNTIELFPNLTDGKCMIQASVPIESIDVHTADGRLVFSENGRNRNTIELNLRKVRKGALFISVLTMDHQQRVFKVIYL